MKRLCLSLLLLTISLSSIAQKYIIKAYYDSVPYKKAYQSFKDSLRYYCIGTPTVVPGHSNDGMVPPVAKYIGVIPFNKDYVYYDEIKVDPIWPIYVKHWIDDTPHTINICGCVVNWYDHVYKKPVILPVYRERIVKQPVIASKPKAKPKVKEPEPASAKLAGYGHDPSPFDSILTPGGWVSRKAFNERFGDKVWNSTTKTKPGVNGVKKD